MDIDLRTLTVSQMYAHPVPLVASKIPQKLATKPSRLNATTRSRIEDNLRLSLSTQRLRLFPIDSDPDDPGTYQVIHNLIHSKQIKFKDASQWLARHLFDVQPGSSSPGMLLVAKATCNGVEALALMKVDNEKRVGTSEVEEQEDFSYDLDEVETLGIENKVFKAALFVATINEAGEPALEIMASDNQAHGSDGRVLADFFLKNFLGCSHAEDPAIVLRRTTDVVMGHINDRIEDTFEKNRAMNGFLTTLDSADPTLNLDTIMSDWIPSEVQDELTVKLHKAGITAIEIEKDTSDLDKAKYLSCVMSNGLRIIGPKDKLFEMLEPETDGGLPHIRLEGTIVNYKLRKRFS